MSKELNKPQLNNTLPPEDKKGRSIFPPEIKLPKEIQLLEKLNKLGEEEYKRWRHKKELTDKLLGKTTLVIGVRGKDGIILGGDTKVIRGGEIDFQRKIKTLVIKDVPIIFAAAGVLGVIDDFIEVFEKTLTESFNKGEISSLLSVKFIAEDLVKSVEQRYGPRLGESPLHFIFGGLSDLTKGKAILYEVGSPGFGQKIQFFSFIGHGSPYARTIGKYLFPKEEREDESGEINLPCTEIIKRVAFSIYWIGGEVDDYVGGEPQIVYIIDEKAKIEEAKYDRDLIKREVDKTKEFLRNITFTPEIEPITEQNKNLLK